MRSRRRAAAQAGRASCAAAAEFRARDDRGDELHRELDLLFGVERGQADAEEEAGRRVGEVVAQGPAPGDIAAAARQRLAQRAHPEIDVVAVDRKMLAEAAPGRAEDAERMRLVDHEEGLMAAA